MLNPDMVIEDVKEGDSFSFTEKITEAMVGQFAQLSGDLSPLHMDQAFALKRGFRGRVVHGSFLTSFFSRVVGMHLPGKNAILQSMDVKFLAPVYIGDTLTIKALVDQVSLATRTIVLKATIERDRTNELLVRSKIMVGFTQEGHA